MRNRPLTAQDTFKTLTFMGKKKKKKKKDGGHRLS